ncbi:hypothetical protein LCGC14_0858150 [marine sediment metagenome]|uniref:Uncharacterized protein n=1 Tax=marine sediment metagenome TaxID=412755 RepID=A0A0F9PD24_9ZZZZ
MAKTLTLEDIQTVPLGSGGITLNEIPVRDLGGNIIADGVNASLPPDTYKALKQHEDPIELLPADLQEVGRRVMDLQLDPANMAVRVKNSLYFSEKFGISMTQADIFSGEIAKQKWDIPNMSPEQIFAKIQETEDTLLKNQVGESFDLAPFSTFGKAFKQSLAGKPAAAVRGVTVFTGEAGEGPIVLGVDIDKMLNKASDFFENLRDQEDRREIDIKIAGKLWPVNEGEPWWKLSTKQIPEAINAWAANISDQIPLMLLTLAGRATGGIIATPAAAKLSAAVALVTGGPDPTDVVTVPVVAAATIALGKHLGGMAPMVSIEAAGFMDYANELGLDKDIAEKYARWYGPISGLIEYSQQIFRLKAFSGLAEKAQQQLLFEIIKKVGGLSIIEGLEELSQESLQNHLIGKAIDEQKLRNPEFATKKPRLFEGGGRAFAIGTGVSLFTQGSGRATRRSISFVSDAVQAKTDKTTIELAESPARELIRIEIEKNVIEAEKTETAKGVSEDIETKIQEVAPVTEQVPVELTEQEAADKLGTTLEQIRFNNELRDRLNKNKIIITDDIRAEFKAESKKGPGLTKAEQAILTPEQQRQARFAQTEGEKVGFKQAEKESREQARREVSKIQAAKKLTAQLQKTAKALIDAFVVDKDTKNLLKAKLKSDVKTAEDLKPFMDSVTEGIEEAERKGKVKDIIKATKRIKPDKMRKPFGNAARKLLDSFKVGKKRVETQIKISDLLDYARQVIDTVAPDSIAAVEAQDMIDRLQNERAKTIGIRDLDSQSLQQILDTLTSLETMDAQESSIITEEQAKEVESRRETLKTDARANSRPINENETIGQKIGRSVKNFIANGHGNLESVSDNISGGIAGTIDLWLKSKKNLTAFVYDVINKGVDEQTKYARKVRNVYRAVLKKHGVTKETVKKWFEDSHVFEMKDGKGNKKSFSFTTNELMSIFMHTRNQHNLDVLRENGMNRFLPGKRTVEIRGFTNELLDRMTESLTARQKAVAKDIGTQLMDGSNKVAINKTSQSLEGRDIAIVIHYWPARRAIVRDIAGKKLEGVQKLIESLGIFKERTGTGNPLRMSGFFETVYNTNKQTAAYVGLAPALRDAKSVLSVDVREEYIRNGWGKEISVIEEFIRRIEDNAPQVSQLDTVVKRLVGKFARSRFALNVKIWVRQQVSSLLTFAYVDAKHIRAFRGVATAEDIASIKELSPQIGARFESFRFDRDIGDASLENELEEYLTGELSLKDSFLLGMKYFDTNAIVDLYRASLSEIADARPDLDQNSQEFKDLLKSRFEWLVRHTQPVWHVKDRSLLGSDPRPLVRALTMFMSQREQMVRMVTGASVEFSNSNKDTVAQLRLAKVYGAVGLNIAMFTMYNAAWALLVRKKKKTILDIGSEFVQNMFGNLFFGRYAAEIIRVTTNKVQGKGFGQVSFEAAPVRLLQTGGNGLVNLSAAAFHFITGDIYLAGPNRNQEKWKNELLVAIDNLIDFTSGVTGLPYVGPKDIVSGIKTWGEEIDFEDEVTTGRFR